MKKYFVSMLIILIQLFSFKKVLSQILYMPLDSNTLDLSGHNNHGIIQGNVTHANDRFGIPNKAYHFAGTINDYIYIPINVNNYDFQIVQSDSISISLWAQPEHNGFDQYLFAKRELSWGPTHSSDFDIQMGLQQAIISTTFGISFQADYNDYYSVTPMNWYHLVVTFGNGVADLYVNDTLRGSNATAIIDSLASMILIGKYYKGEIDDINVYHKILTAVEIDSLFRIGMSTDINTIDNINKYSKISPNPTNGFINIQSSHINIDRLVILDISGHQVQNIEMNSTDINIDLSERRSGVYFLELISNNKVIERHKLIKTE